MRFNKSRSLIATSGVEKVIKLWSVLPINNTDEADDDTEQGRERRVFSRDEYVGLVMRTSAELDYNAGSTQENPRMMAFFDSLVQREIQGSSDSDESSDDEEEYHDTVASDDSDNDRPAGADTDTATPRQSSENIIAQMIEKKRNKLRKKSLRKHQRRSGSSTVTDPEALDRILQSASEALRTDSDSSDSSSSRSSLLSLSSILQRASENSDSDEEILESLPSSSEVHEHNKEILQNLQRRKRQLQESDEPSQSSSQTSEPVNSDVMINFKKVSKNRKMRRRSSSSSEED